MSEFRKLNIITSILPIALLAIITTMLFPRVFSSQQIQFSTIFLTLFIIIELILFFLPLKNINQNTVTPDSAKKDFFNKNIHWNIALMVIFSFLGTILYIIGLAYYEPDGLDPFNAQIKEIKSITISPSGNAHTNLLNKSIILTERQDIKLIVETLNTATHIRPNHPGTQWKCDITLQTENNKRTINISNTGGSTNGVLVYWQSPNMGLNLETYRCDPIGPILEQFVAFQHNLKK